MANSTTNLNTISASDSGKETLVNQLLDAASPATAFGRRPQSSGLTWHFYGATILVNGTPTQVANNSIALTGGTVTNFVERDLAGTVTTNTAGFTFGRIPLYQITVVSGAVTAWTDFRSTEIPPAVDGRATVTVTTGDVNLSHAQARCRIIEVSGAKNAARNLIVPTQPGFWIIANYGTSSGGPFTLTVKTLAGTGIAFNDASGGIAKVAMVACDNTNVIRVTAESVGSP